MDKQIKLQIYDKNLINLINKCFINIGFNINEKLDLSLNVSNLELQATKECVFDLVNPIQIKQENIEKILPKEDCDSEILSILDDLIFDEIQSNLWTYFNTELRRANDLLFADLSEQINKAVSLETLYFKIRTDKIVYPSYIKDYILYKLLLENSLKIKEISIVEDFIDTFYQIKYADLILKYPTLSMDYKNKFLNNKNINPVILQDYLNQIDSLPDFFQLLASENLSEISNYYFKMWDNILFDNQSFVVNQLLKYPRTPEPILFDIYTRYAVIFIHQDLLIHSNCPKSILLNYATVPSYISYIIKNPLLDDSIVEKILSAPIDEYSLITTYNTILANQNISNDLKKIISQKLAFLTSFNNEDFIKSNSIDYWHDLMSGKIFNNKNISLSEKIFALNRIKKVLNSNEFNTSIDLLQSEVEALSAKNFPDKKAIENDYITEILNNNITENNKKDIIDTLIINKNLHLIPENDLAKELTINLIKNKINNNYTLAIDLAEYLLSNSITDLWGMKVKLSNNQKNELISLLNSSEIPFEIKNELNKIAS
jgi:hypothetical protein